MEITELGMIIEANLLHPSKAESPIEVTKSPNTTSDMIVIGKTDVNLTTK